MYVSSGNVVAGESTDIGPTTYAGVLGNNATTKRLEELSAVCAAMSWALVKGMSVGTLDVDGCCIISVNEWLEPSCPSSTLLKSISELIDTSVSLIKGKNNER